MASESVVLSTRDGACTASVCTPDGAGPWPAAILYMDAGGIRPAALEMAQHLADGGYVVLLPDPFYRYGRYGPLVPRDVFAGDVMATLGPLMATTNPLKAAQDTEAFLAFLQTRSDVAGRTVGAVGFCMGAGMAIASAATHSASIRAVASFHGGGLATDEPTSPHLAASHLQGEVYIAAATDDASYPPPMAHRFEASLAASAARYEAVVYPAAHGWMVPDFPTFDAVAAERGWEALRSLFARNLRIDR